MWCVFAQSSGTDGAGFPIGCSLDSNYGTYCTIITFPGQDVACHFLSIHGFVLSLLYKSADIGDQNIRHFAHILFNSTASFSVQNRHSVANSTGFLFLLRRTFVFPWCLFRGNWRWSSGLTATFFVLVCAVHPL